MKQYVIDELRIEDFEKLRAHLDETLGFSGSDGLYWVPIDDSMLTEIQAGHAECKPLYFAIELEESKMACELLVRTRNKIRCECIAYADQRQRNWFIKTVDSIFEKLEIII